MATEENKGAGAGIGWTWLLADQQHNIRLTPGQCRHQAHQLPAQRGTYREREPRPRRTGLPEQDPRPSGDIRLDHRNYTPGINILTTPDPLLVPDDPQT